LQLVAVALLLHPNWHFRSSAVLVPALVLSLEKWKKLNKIDLKRIKLNLKIKLIK
jgi:hypothetical protein